MESLQAPPEAEAAGIHLAHETPGASDDVLWTTGYPAPSNLRAMEILRERPGTHASGDLYAPIAYFLPSGGGVRRRLFLSAGKELAPEGSMLLCPGSVATASASPGGGSVMTWENVTRELAVVRFGPDGARAEVRRHVILCYCEDMGERLPDDAVLERVDLRVRADADQIAAEVAAERPDLVLLDYHLAGKLSGLDAILALRARGDMPVPVLGIAPDPAESEGLKAVGAVGGLPFSYLKDALTRLILELTGLSS